MKIAMKNKNDTASGAFNLNQAAEYLGINKITMAKLAQTPDFPAFKIGRRWVIPREALIDWMEERAADNARL